MGKLQYLSRLRKSKIRRGSQVFKNNEERITAFRKWYAEGGKFKLVESMNRVDRVCGYLKRARAIDWSRIHEPMTI